MRVIHVLRKPLGEGSVAANVLAHGTGAIHVDACRVLFVSEGDEQESKTKNQHDDFGSGAMTGNTTYGDYSMVPRKNYNPPGRWPANLILQHLPTCQQGGSEQVSGNGHYPASRPSGSDVSGPSGHKGQESLSEATLSAEMVAVWEDGFGCPVATLGAEARFFKQLPPHLTDDDEGGGPC